MRRLSSSEVSRLDERKLLRDLLAASRSMSNAQKMALMLAVPQVYWPLVRLCAAHEAREEVQGYLARRRGNRP